MDSHFLHRKDCCHNALPWEIDLLTYLWDRRRRRSGNRREFRELGFWDVERMLFFYFCFGFGGFWYGRCLYCIFHQLFAGEMCFRWVPLIPFVERGLLMGPFNIRWVPCYALPDWEWAGSGPCRAWAGYGLVVLKLSGPRYVSARPNPGHEHLITSFWMWGGLIGARMRVRWTRFGLYFRLVRWIGD